MLTLPPFELHSPTSLEQAIALLATHRGDVKVLAGGTDLLPNLKHRLYAPGHLVALSAIPRLAEISDQEKVLCLGAGLSIASLAAHPLVTRWAPSLAMAARSIASPQLRQMGTLGGNLCLDTRCVYFNQSAFWRKALGYCLKKDGTLCHVVKGGTKCVAAASSDLAPVLLTLGARVLLSGGRGNREVPVADLFRADGAEHLALGSDELLTEVWVPKEDGRLLAGHQKLRMREAIDFPALSVAVAAKLDPEDRLEWVRIAVSALGSRPHQVGALEAFVGRELDEQTILEMGQLALRQCHPLTNLNVDPIWRREMIAVFVKRAFARVATPGNSGKTELRG